MWDYSEKVLELFYNPVNQGAIAPTEEPDTAVVFGEVGSIACGDALRLHLKIQPSTDMILDARFQTFGCTSAIASSSALTELVKGKTLDAALQVTNHEIADYLGGLPEAKMHCSVMGQEALEAAINNYRGIATEVHADDDGVLVCSCFGITAPRIRRVILENGLTTVEQVTNYVKAGGGCGTCLANIEDILLEVQAEQEFTPVNVAASIAINDATTTPPPATAATATATATYPPASATTLTTVQKILFIQQVLEQEIRPVLIADGGDVELHDVEGDRVLVRLKGACSSCSSSTETLKLAIEAQLKERVLPTLEVAAI